jgi:uncharacterized surface protein with fasciclin (FAS1) repeats
MKTFCHNCGAQAVDDKSLFCNICGARLLTNIPKNYENCPNCGAQAVDGKSLFCNICGTRLIPYIPKKYEDCPNCGANISNKESRFCLWCGSPLAATNPEGSPISFGSGDKPDIKETIPSHKVSIFPENTVINRSQKSKSQKPFKRLSIVLPSILFIIAFVLIFWIISQAGVLDPLFSIGSTNTSQEDLISPAQVTSTIPPIVITLTPKPQVTKTNAQVTSTMTPPVTATLTPQATKTNTQVTSTMTPPVTTATPTPQVTKTNIVQTIRADGRFTNLVTALQAANLAETLSDPDSNFTIFAPTDAVFQDLPSGTMDTLLKDPQGDLLQILLYHMVNGKVMAADLRKLSSVETLQGGSLSISVTDNTILVDGGTVVITDIECSNGVIHVIDSLLLPPA